MTRRDAGFTLLELLVSPLPHEVLLHVPQARLVLGRFLEDRAVPEQSARRIVARRGVERG